MKAEPVGTADGLNGTLLLPEAAPPYDCVLLLPGSGPVDRDGNAPALSTDCLRLLAEGLAARGIASLRADKRGVGESSDGIREQDIRLETYVADALTWLRELRARPGFGRLFILGHSEGALVGTLATQRAAVHGLIVVNGAGVPLGQVLRRQLGEAGVLDQAEPALLALERGETAPTPPGLEALFRPSVQPYLISWMAYDPAAELARVTTPVLVVSGTADLQVPQQDALRLAAARPDARLVLIKGMNHVLKMVSDHTANLATYGDPTFPIAKELIEAVVSSMS